MRAPLRFVHNFPQGTFADPLLILMTVQIMSSRHDRKMAREGPTPGLDPKFIAGREYWSSPVC